MWQETRGHVIPALIVVDAEGDNINEVPVVESVLSCIDYSQRNLCRDIGST